MFSKKGRCAVLISAGLTICASSFEASCGCQDSQTTDAARKKCYALPNEERDTCLQSLCAGDAMGDDNLEQLEGSYESLGYRETERALALQSPEVASSMSWLDHFIGLAS